MSFGIRDIRWISSMLQDPLALKDFVHMRDVNPIFAPIRKEGRFGTPFFVLEDGTETHDLEEVLKHKD